MMNATNNSTSSKEYCDLDQFQQFYRPVHAYLSIIVCVFGSITNVLNIRILMTKDMRTPTNLILSGLAVADLLVMLEYIPFSVHSYSDIRKRFYPDFFTYPWAIYMYFHACFAIALHFTACCLTVLLAIWRYIAISLPQKNLAWCSMQNTKLAIFISYILCPLICIPIFMESEVKQITRDLNRDGTFSQDLTNETVLKATLHVMKFKETGNTLMFLIYSVILKLLPCIFLTIMSFGLIHELVKAKERWKNLSGNAGMPLVKAKAKQDKMIEKEQQADRTTRMLLAVLLLFLLTEFPQAIMGLISIFLHKNFHLNCYQKLGDLFDIIALTNSAITFILYCSMSQQFRTEFHRIFMGLCFLCLKRRKSKSKEAFTDTTEL